MKYFLGFYQNRMIFVKQQDKKFYKAQSYSNETITFEELPYKPKLLMELDSIPTQNKNYLTNKHRFHSQFNDFLKKNGYSNYRLITESPYEESLLFTVISSNFKDRCSQETSAMITLTNDLSFPKILDFSVHCIDPETWNTRRY